MAVVPYRQDQAPRLDFWGSDIRNHTTEGDTLWVNYTTSEHLTGDNVTILGASKVVTAEHTLEWTR